VVGFATRVGAKKWHKSAPSAAIAADVVKGDNGRAGGKLHGRKGKFDQARALSRRQRTQAPRGDHLVEAFLGFFAGGFLAGFGAGASAAATACAQGVCRLPWSSSRLRQALTLGITTR